MGKTEVRVVDQDALNEALATHQQDVGARILIGAHRGTAPLKVDLPREAKCTVIADGKARVQTRGKTHLTARDQANVQALDRSRIDAYGEAVIYTPDPCLVVAHDNVEIFPMYGRATVWADGEAHVQGSAELVELRGFAQAMVFDATEVRAFGSSFGSVHGNSVAYQYGEARIKATDQVKVVAEKPALVTVTDAATIEVNAQQRYVVSAWVRWEAAQSPSLDEGVVVYSMPGCVGCEQTKRLLSTRGVDLTEVDLSQRPDLVEQFKREGLMSAPVVQSADGVRTAGFDFTRIQEIIAATSAPSRSSHSAPSVTSSSLPVPQSANPSQMRGRVR